MSGNINRQICLCRFVRAGLTHRGRSGNRGRSSMDGNMINIVHVRAICTIRKNAGRMRVWGKWMHAVAEDSAEDRWGLDGEKCQA
jgi:hypothetical protein